MNDNPTINPDELEPHPKNEDIYGNEDLRESLVRQIKSDGILDAVIVTNESYFQDGTVIISGHQRVKVANELDIKVPIDKRTYESRVDELDKLLQHNNYRDKTFSQRMNEADAIAHIEETAAKERMQNPMQTNAEGKSGLSRDRIAERIGIGSGETYRKAKYIWNFDDDTQGNGDNRSHELIAEIDTGDASISSAYSTLKDIEEANADTVDPEDVESDTSETTSTTANVVSDPMQELAEDSDGEHVQEFAEDSDDVVCPECGHEFKHGDDH